MNKQAIYHITDIPYAYAEDENTLCVTVRASVGEAENCMIYYKDRYDWESPFCFRDMKLVSSDGLFDYFETKIHVAKNRYMYFFKIKSVDGEILYYNERGFHSEPVKEKGAFEFPYIAWADIYESPSWAQEGILYQIFPDRFSNSDKGNDPDGVCTWGDAVTRTSMFGGDLQGIIDKIPYLKDLGITIIYLTPIFLSSTNHKYNTRDYYKIDPNFGNVETIKNLVKCAHENGIKIILDAVFNHSGNDFFAFLDVLENQENSKYKDWFFINDFPVSIDKVNYETFANNAAYMPKLNTKNPEVKEYLLSVSEYWIKEADIDGWRLDVCDEVDHLFWREFRKRVKAIKADTFIIGEIHHEATAWLRGEQLDSIMNYPFSEVMIDFFARRAITAEDMEYELSAKRALYMKNINMNLLNLLDSHDTARFLNKCGEQIQRMKLAIAFQYTYIGIPYIYYGDEVGLSGGNDPYCRKCMIWNEDSQNKELLKFYKDLNNIRKENKSLIYGDYACVYKKDNVIAFKRVWKDEELLVVLNNSDEISSIKIEGIDGEYSDLLNNNNVVIEDRINLMENDIKILRKCSQ